MIDPALDRFIAEAQAFAPEYGDGLSSHLTMSLVALTRLGAGAAQREAFTRAYMQKLDRATFADPHRFRAALERRDPHHVAQETLERLGDGMAGAAGHGLLRVYFALEAEELLSPGVFRDELSRGLDYFADSHTRLGGDRPRAGGTPLVEALAGAAPLGPEVLARISSQRMITTRQLLVAQTPGFAALIGRAALDFDWAEVLSLLARIGARDADFTVMHALTTGQAILDLAARLPALDLTPLRRGWIDFVAAAWLTESLRPVDERPPGAPREQTLSRVYASLDDHAPKAAFSLSRLEARFGRPEFAAAAAAFVGRYAGPAWSG